VTNIRVSEWFYKQGTEKIEEYMAKQIVVAPFFFLLSNLSK
jgi:hypothetical protein